MLRLLSIILTGDFNQPAADWSNPAIAQLISSSHMCLTHMRHLHKPQRNFHRDSVFLDLIFTSDHNFHVTMALEDLIPPEGQPRLDILQPNFEPD